MREQKRGKGRVVFVLLCVGAFIISFVLSACIKMKMTSLDGPYKTDWNENVGTVYADISYGEAETNKFDLYLPADNSRDSYGLVVYLHAGGFAIGDKSDDAAILKWLCSKGYVAAGVNYSLRNTEDLTLSIYDESIEIKNSMPKIIEEAANYGYSIDEITISGGSAGGCLALIYAYRDADESPVPVRMVFEAVGPSCFYPEDWKSYGFDQNKEGAAGLFSIMSGKKITEDMFGTPEYDEAMKDVSALLWVDENTVPTLMCYGAYDTQQPFEGSKRLNAALTENNVPHDYLVAEHSGHGLQNDTKIYKEYVSLITEYLDKYMPVK